MTWIDKRLIVLLLLMYPVAAFTQYKRFTFQQPKMGSPFNIIIYAVDSAGAANGAAIAFALADSLNLIYSDYLPNSELNRLCKQAGNGQWVTVSPALYQILKLSYRASQLSNGVFDITASPVIRLWRQARQNHQLPAADSIKHAMQKVGYRNIQFNLQTQQVRLAKKGMQLDLGGIAKGETAQRMKDTLTRMGFVYCLVDAGGDIVVGEPPPGRKGWRIAINLPEAEETMDRQLLLSQVAVTTSGDLYQYLEINNARYSHIINPVNGKALTNSRNVTVIAKNGTDADWLTKACSILPISKALRLVKQFEGAEVQIGELKNGLPVYYRSPGFAARFE